MTSELSQEINEEVKVSLTTVGEATTRMIGTLHRYSTHKTMLTLLFRRQHPSDNSIVTYRGHKVLRTLIRCHFSPPGSTNSRYVYSGSEDGKVYIWNMDATLAGTVDVYAASKDSRPTNRTYYEMDWDEDEGNRARWKTCVRDASWHPNAPMIVASAWNGYGMSTGTCTVHSWNDGAEEDEAEPKMGLRVNQKLEVDPRLYARERPPPNLGRRGVPFGGRGFGGRTIGGRLYTPHDDDEDDDDDEDEEINDL